MIHANPPTIPPVVTAGARGIGHAVVGPLVGSALSSPDVLWAAVKLAAILGAGVAAGVYVGHRLGK